jgi:indolepyruvate ferredoxin oxidoreductase
MPALSILARCKSLRGTPFDPFGYTHERKRERSLRARYLDFARELATGLRADNKDLALEIAQLPGEVRGYGHVKLAALDVFDKQWDELLAQFRTRQEQRHDSALAMQAGVSNGTRKT